jgi:hypothetical protein
MNFAHRLTETVSYKTPSGVSSSGDLTYGSLSTLNARIYRKTQIVSNANGAQVTSNYVIETETQIPLDARIWLPGASTSDNNAAQRVLSSEYASTLDGSYTLYLTYC